MKPYYQDEWVTQYCGDALKVLPELESESIDLLATDPPYGISFMGKDWDKALPDKRIWAECFRVLKPGSFAFVMSIPRADCLSRMIISLEDAGFWVNFTPIFWAYASGFPKAQNIGKAVDKRLGAEREVIGKNPNDRGRRTNPLSDYGLQGGVGSGKITEPATPQAKALDGSYGGFQPKPAVEVIIVAMKPLSEKTFVDQALKNGKGITWLDDGRIPYESEQDKEQHHYNARGMDRLAKDYGEKLGTSFEGGWEKKSPILNNRGRFPANLLVSDDVLNDGRVRKSGKDINPTTKGNDTAFFGSGSKYYNQETNYGDSGSFSRYFDLDKWAQKTFPFLIVPKASKSEKNKGCEELTPTPKCLIDKMGGEKCTMKTGSGNIRNVYYKNNHPTVKPLKLISYLITLGSRAGDIVLDPFGGSGTTALACQLLNRKNISIEIEEKYCEIAANRCRQTVMDLSS